MGKITIIGASMMGSALAFPARENGHEVFVVGTPLDKDIITECKKSGKHPKFEKPFPQGVKFFYFEDWKNAVVGSTFVVAGVSSFGVDWFLNEVLFELDPKMPVLSVAKGLMDLEDGTLITYNQYWERELAKKGINRTICAIGGPCTAPEFVAQNHTEVAFCGKNREELKMMKDMLKTSYHHISLTSDVIGLESAVALKNGYALGIAMNIGNEEKDGEKPHYNSQAAAFYQATKEMSKLLTIQGASEKSSFIGFGDLFVTVCNGRTRKAGILFGQGLSYEESIQKLAGLTIESLVVIKRVVKAVKKQAERGLLSLDDFPFLMHIDQVINNKKDPALPWESFTYED